MATRLAASDDAIQILGEFRQSKVAHMNFEALRAGRIGLPKGDVAPQSRLNREAPMVPNVFFDESFKLPIYGGADFQWNALVRTTVEFRASIIRVE
jgi:hypothetical protein